MRNRVIAGLTIVLSACTTVSPQGSSSESSVKPSSFAAQTSILGALAYGETSSPVAYTEKPRYRAFSFAGKAGDSVDIWVRSTDGDATAWLLDHRFNTITSNDNAAAGTTDSHIALTLATSDSSFYIAFREREQADATFTVTLTGPTSTPPPSSPPPSTPPPSSPPPSTPPPSSPPPVAKTWQLEAIPVPLNLFYDDQNGGKPASGAVVAVSSFWGSGAGDVWASITITINYTRTPASDDYSLTYNALAHRNSSGSWGIQRVTNNYAPYPFVVWGSAANDLYAASGSLFHSTGNGTWTAVSINSDDAELTQVYGSGANDVWAGSPTILHHWNGSTWASKTINWGSAWWPSDCYGGVGLDGLWTDGTIVRGVGEIVISGCGADMGEVAVIDADPEDATAFVPTQTFQLNLGSYFFGAIVASSANDVFVTGQAPSGGLVMHDNGSGTWNSEANPFFNIAGTWLAGPGELYLVGLSPQGERLLEHRAADGSYTAIPTGITTNAYSAVWGSAADDLYIGEQNLAIPTTASIYHLK